MQALSAVAQLGCGNPLRRCREASFYSGKHDVDNNHLIVTSSDLKLKIQLQQGVGISELSGHGEAELGRWSFPYMASVLRGSG